MSSTESPDLGEQPCFRLENLPGNSTHLTGKASPQVNNRWDAPEVTANGVQDIENRILRITGYYGYNPGYSSHK
ncbi:putative solute carrier family 35 member F4, partial [Triplophysa rosa]